MPAARGVTPRSSTTMYPSRWSEVTNYAGLRTGVRYSLLSSVVPLFDDRVTFNDPGGLHIVRQDGHLQGTRFVPVAGGSPAELRHDGWLRVHAARVERRRDEWCVVAEGLGALEWEPRPPLRGRDWWLRVRYWTDPAEPVALHSKNSGGWIEERRKLPASVVPGTAIADLDEGGKRRRMPAPVSTSRPWGACACDRLRSAPLIPRRPRQPARRSRSSRRSTAQSDLPELAIRIAAIRVLSTRKGSGAPRCEDEVVDVSGAPNVTTRRLVPRRHRTSGVEPRFPPA